MSLSVRNVEYFYVRIHDGPDKAYGLLAQLASEEVNLLAFRPGLDQVNLRLVPALRGVGVAKMVLTVDGIPKNAVSVDVR